ncbi:MAG: Ni/Fe-hydrogenase cytochrome b subunit [Acidobacteria bacterium]|nr:Ni/Fe-hydrogenase cytochrome b subunit [Acidobacteriota bacterium]
MSTLAWKWPQSPLRITPWRAIAGLILLAGLAATLLRFSYGLGASTNLTDQFPWGLWVGFDVLCGVMLAAGGFTITTVVHIFNIERFKPIIRPTVLTAFLGYSLVVIALLFDLGRGWKIWHAIIMWNPRSVMFEVAWCVMLYTTVLALEFAPVVFESLHLNRAAKWLRSFGVPLVLAGALLSTLHQSSLGSLYLIMPSKLYPLWYSPLLPIFFFVSAIGIGLAMTIVESSLSSRYFKKQLELPLLQELGRILAIVLLFYFVLRLQDLVHRGVLSRLLEPRVETWFFLLEIGAGVLLPIALLFTPYVRRSPGWLLASASLVILGFMTNRLNVSIIGMWESARFHYVPKWSEIAVSAMIITVGVFIFAAAAKHLPIFSSNGTEKATH